MDSEKIAPASNIGGIARGPVFFDEHCASYRNHIEMWAERVKELMNHVAFTEPKVEGRDHGEMKANIMIAYRHLEDARMRLGKAIQAYDGGVSVYKR